MRRCYGTPSKHCERLRRGTKFEYTLRERREPERRIDSEDGRDRPLPHRGIRIHVNRRTEGMHPSRAQPEDVGFEREDARVQTAAACRVARHVAQVDDDPVG